MRTILLTVGLVSLLGAVPADALARPGGPMRGPGMGPDRAERAERREERVLERVAELDPARAAQLEALKSDHPAAYRMLMVNSIQMLRHVDEDPGVADRFFQMIDLVEELAVLMSDWTELSDKKQTKRRAEVDDVVGRLFDVRQEERRARLAAMEARLEQMRTDIEQREADKDDIVGEFVDTAIDNAQNPPAEGAPPARRRGGL